MYPEWKFDDEDFERLNVNGSGISLGHPVGATGGRILATLLREMDRRQGRYGLETMCIGGGQGLAAVFERGRLMDRGRPRGHPGVGRAASCATGVVPWSSRSTTTTRSPAHPPSGHRTWDCSASPSLRPTAVLGWGCTKRPVWLWSSATRPRRFARCSVPTTALPVMCCCSGAPRSSSTEWLPRVASGEVVASFALTEPDAGSTRLTCALVPDLDGIDWVLNGTKRYITNAPLADLFLVFARTDPAATGARGISYFIVPRDTPGLGVGPSDRKMGQFGAKTADVLLDDVRLPSSAVVGGDEGLGKGYVTAMGCLAHGRVHIAALCVGMAERLVDESVSYAQNRMQGGKPIASFQLIQGLVADSQTDYLAGRSLVLAVAEDFDRGTNLKGGPSCAKYFASEMVGRVADRAVQIHGGLGYMRGVPVERFFRDARLFRIYEGTSQIQQVIIARELLGKAVQG